MAGKMNKDERLKIDAHDVAIINELIENPKTPLRELGKKLRISFVTALNRIKRLEKGGIIRQYTTKVDYEKLGYGTHALIQVRISKGRFGEFSKMILKEPSIYAAYDITGEFDSAIIGHFKSTQSMDKFLKRFQSYDFVERTYTALILHTIKENPMAV
ncbi:MAG TPA: Lrp/AsnC family transcriptional regulator [Candidatus Nanoarchaeia archaeon]|nr:Lrp/AsnC family transcriptional regulator [Candidatus Nanoarchaeia archaeon]